MEVQNPEKEDEWVNIIGSGGLKKKLLIPGEKESRPTPGDVATIDAKGYLEDGTVIEDLKSFEFTVDGGEIIDGIDLIVKLMEKGEESEVFMEARFAYGQKGTEYVSPNVDLYYKIKLIDFKTEAAPEDIEISARLDIGIRKRERGNWWFNREDYKPSVKCYKSAIDFLDDTSDTLGETISEDLRILLNERLITLNNMAAAQIKLEAYDMAIKSLDLVLTCNPENVKALYRKGKVLGLQGKYAEGYQLLKRAMITDPDSKGALFAEATHLQKKMKEEAEKEKSLYRRMLGLKPSAASVINGSITQPDDRYFTVRSMPFKVWGIVFVVLLASLVLLQSTYPLFSTDY